MQEIKNVLSENVKRFRKLRGFTQESFAEAIGKSLSTVQSLEGGKSWPEEDTLLKVLKTLDLNSMQLFTPPMPLNPEVDKALFTLAATWGLEIKKKN